LRVQFFLLSLVWSLLPNFCGCRALLLRPITIYYTHTHTHTTLYDFSGWGIGPSPRPLLDSTQHSQQTGIHAPAGFEPAIPAIKGPQSNALDRASTGILQVTRVLL